MHRLCRFTQLCGVAARVRQNAGEPLRVVLWLQRKSSDDLQHLFIAHKIDPVERKKCLGEIAGRACQAADCVVDITFSENELA